MRSLWEHWDCLQGETQVLPCFQRVIFDGELVSLSGKTSVRAKCHLHHYPGPFYLPPRATVLAVTLRGAFPTPELVRKLEVRMARSLVTCITPDQLSKSTFQSLSLEVPTFQMPISETRFLVTYGLKLAQAQKGKSGLMKLKQPRVSGMA